MGRKKIKQPGSHKKKVRGHRQHQNLQSWERVRAENLQRAQARRARLMKRDAETGEEYALARLGLKDPSAVDDYRDGLAVAVDEADEDAVAQAEAIRAYLQGWVDEGRLVPIPCERGAKPVCRVYGGENKRVVVIRQDDPDANSL